MEPTPACELGYVLPHSPSRATAARMHCVPSASGNDGGEAYPDSVLETLFQRHFTFTFQREAAVLLLSAQFESDMAVRKPRSRMISVRLSEEEYSALRELCSATGARSVSDITRDAMRVLLDDVNRVNTAGSRWDEFRSQMRILDKRIEQLAAEITTFKTDDNH